MLLFSTSNRQNGSKTSKRLRSTGINEKEKSTSTKFFFPWGIKFLYHTESNAGNMYSSILEFLTEPFIIPTTIISFLLRLVGCFRSSIGFLEICEQLKSVFNKEHYGVKQLKSETTCFEAIKLSSLYFKIIEGFQSCEVSLAFSLVWVLRCSMPVLKR